MPTRFALVFRAKVAMVAAAEPAARAAKAVSAAGLLRPLGVLVPVGPVAVAATVDPAAAAAAVVAASPLELQAWALLGASRIKILSSIRRTMKARLMAFPEMAVIPPLASILSVRLAASENRISSFPSKLCALII